MTTPTEDQLKELVSLEQTVKILHERIKFIKDLCKERGSFCTDNYVCAVITQTRTGLVGMEAVVHVFGKAVLEKHHLIRTSTVQVVKVSEKVSE